MLNLKGAFVVIGDAPPRAVVLAEFELNRYIDRIGISGYDKANAFQFGHWARSALPCDRECMEFMALNFEGPHKVEVRGLCAAVALGQPIGNGKDLTEGGLKVAVPAPRPRKPSPANAVAVTTA